MGLTALVHLRRNECYGFLWPLKIHRPRPGLNSQTLGPMASMITTTPPRPTNQYNLVEVYRLLEIHAASITELLITLMIQTGSTSEASVSFYQTTWRNIPEDSHLHTNSLFMATEDWILQLEMSNRKTAGRQTALSTEKVTGASEHMLCVLAQYMSECINRGTVSVHLPNHCSEWYWTDFNVTRCSNPTAPKIRNKKDTQNKIRYRN
jgi:hypothetical protein